MSCAIHLNDGNSTTLVVNEDRADVVAMMQRRRATLIQVVRTGNTNPTHIAINSIALHHRRRDEATSAVAAREAVAAEDPALDVAAQRRPVGNGAPRIGDVAQRFGARLLAVPRSASITFSIA